MDNENEQVFLNYQYPQLSVKMQQMVDCDGNWQFRRMKPSERDQELCTLRARCHCVKL